LIPLFVIAALEFGVGGGNDLCPKASPESVLTGNVKSAMQSQ